MGWEARRGAGAGPTSCAAASRCAFERELSTAPSRQCRTGETVTTTEYGKKARCSYGDVITDAKRELLKKRILPRATDFLEKMLSVHRVDGPLRLGSIACGYEGGVRVPEWMRDKGLDDAVRAHCMRTRA